MPTTSYVSPTVSAAVLGARTDSGGGPVSDYTAEEARLLATILTEGYLKPANAFVVAAQAVPNMTVKVGSGAAKADHYVVAGENAGQGNYVVRLDVTSENVTIDPADSSQARTDEIYLVVRDNAYDISARVLPQLGYRKGDLGGANPGPDAAWKASVLLARVAVAAAATTVTSGNITDLRSAAALLSGLAGVGDHGLLTGLADEDHPAYLAKSLVDAKGDLLVGTAADAVSRLPVGASGQLLKANSAEATGLEWVNGPGFRYTAGALVPLSSISYVTLAAGSPLSFTTTKASQFYLLIINPFTARVSGGPMRVNYAYALSGANTDASDVAISEHYIQASGQTTAHSAGIAALSLTNIGTTQITVKAKVDTGSVNVTTEVIVIPLG